MATFYSRANGQGGCNICRGYNYGIMFYEEHSDFEKYYDTENNERPSLATQTVLTSMYGGSVTKIIHSNGQL